MQTAIVFQNIRGVPKFLLMRLEEARRQLIGTDKSVTTIAVDLGFSSSQHLSSSYLRHFGLNPRAERKSVSE